MTRTPDVVVVGAGIVGAACAFSLSRRGLRVEVLDSGVVGGGTTAAGMGHLSIMDDSPAQFALTTASCRLWDELAAHLPPNAEYTRDGAIWVAETGDEAAAIPAQVAKYQARGIEADVLNAGDLERLEPELRPGLAGGMLVANDRVLYPPVVTRWFLRYVEAHGGEVVPDCQVVEITSRGVQTQSAFRLAGAVVNAAGPQAPDLMPELPIFPRKGHLVITERYPRFVRRQLLELGYLKSAHGGGDESVAFNVQPRITGQILIGSSRQHVDWDRTVDDKLVAKMLRRALSFLPGLAELTMIRTWFGFRPATPDNLPLIGRWPRIANSWVAAGHEGLGHTLALATGELLAQQMTGEEPMVDVSPYLPTRKAA